MDNEYQFYSNTFLQLFIPRYTIDGKKLTRIDVNNSYIPQYGCFGMIIDMGG